MTLLIPQIPAGVAEALLSELALARPEDLDPRDEFRYSQAITQPTGGLPISDDDFGRFLACAKGTGAPVLDLRAELDRHPEWYWANDWHFNPEGARVFAKLAAARIRAALGKGLP